MALTEFLLFVLTATLGGIKDVRSNEATNEILLMGGASSSILVHGFSWLYGSSGGEIELQEYFPPAPSHQWTPDVYEGLLQLQATRIFDIPFYFSSNEWHLLLEILAILSMILGNLIAITQTSMKRMLAYSTSNGGYASMITYMLLLYLHESRTFACIVLFGLRTGTDNIRDYAGLYTKDPFLALSLALCLLSLGGLPPLAGLYFLVSIGLLTKRCFYLLLSKNNQVINDWTKQEITPHVRNYRGSPLRSNNSIELSMIVCVIASTIPGISMNPIIEIAQDTLFLASRIYFLVQDPTPLILLTGIKELVDLFRPKWEWARVMNLESRI
ncbi:hypothetical protein AAHE18_11G121400 [Arachis hypogaea]